MHDLRCGPFLPFSSVSALTSAARHPKKDRKRGLLLLLPSFLGVTANAVISYHYLTPVLGSGRHTLLNSFKESLDILFGSGSSIPVSHGAHMLELMMFWFSWGCILAALLYAVRPWLAPSSAGNPTCSMHVPF